MRIVIPKKGTEDEKNKIHIKCSRCQHIWTYTGSNEYLAGCPHCGIRVSIAKNRIMVPQTESVAQAAQSAVPNNTLEGATQGGGTLNG